MAGGAIPTGLRSKAYPGNLTLYVAFTCVVAAMGCLIFGYDIGISGGVTSMDPFLKKFFPSVFRKQSEDTSTNQYCKFDSQTLTMFTSSLYLAELLSSLVASTVTRTLGHKLSRLFGGILFCASALINGFVQAVWMLNVGQILLGFGIGFANQNEFLCELESMNVLPMIESALHAKKCVAFDEPSKPVVNGSKAKSVNKASFKLRQKGSLQSTPSSSFISSKLNPPPCTRISTKVKHGFSQTGYGSNGYVIYNNTNFKYDDKLDFTQTSNSSSMCEYCSSTSISEESSRCSIGNRPHMSIDSRRQAIHDMMIELGISRIKAINSFEQSWD
ncbi:sugar carrier protein C-like protein [Tanacetum coccineum]